MISHRLVLPVLTVVVGTSLSAVAPAPLALAAAPDATAALDLPTGVTAVASGSGLVATQPFDDFPSKGSSYYLLSTGFAGAVFTSEPTEQLSTDRGDDGAADSSTVTLTVPASTGAGCLFVDFALGTEEPVHTYSENVPDDGLTIVKDEVDYAINAGRGYFNQAAWPNQRKPYQVNALNYWHHPGDRFDPIPGSFETPWLPAVTALNSVTTRDTARIPLDFSAGPEVIDITVADEVNGDLDSVAFLDDVRLGPSCGAGTGVEPNPVHDGGVIAGIRGIGNALVYDPIPSTGEVERYDADNYGNGWRSPSGPTVPVELRFRWYRTIEIYALNGDMTKWTPIPDADRQAYVPTVGDKDLVLICLVTGVVDGRRYETFPSTGEAGTWYVTTKIARGTFIEGEAPTIQGPDGTPSVGDLLTASIDNTEPRQDTWAWRWYANGNMISGATNQTFVPSAAEAGKVITVRATAKRLNFDDKTYESAPYGPVELQTWDATDTPTIVTDGAVAYGATLVAEEGDGWLPAPDGYTYQWKSNGSLIRGAVYRSFTVRAEDVGAQLTVVVSGVKTGYLAAPRESAPVSVLGATMPGATPLVSGTPQVGQRLTGSVTGWAPTGSTLTYSWYAGTDLIHQGSTFVTVPASAVGLPIVLKVTGNRPGYTPRTTESAPTAVVTPGALTAGDPRISGVPRVGNTLSAIAGYWAPSGVQLKYRWKIGKNQVAGARGARQTFVIPRTARGKRITLVVTGSLAGYTTIRKLAPRTAKVTR